MPTGVPPTSGNDESMRELRAIVGDEATDELLQDLLAAADNDINRAVNFYFNTQWSRDSVCVLYDVCWDRRLCACYNIISDDFGTPCFFLSALFTPLYVRKSKINK